MSVEVRDLVKIYGSQKAVNDISFTAKEGEIIGFLGPNGAGKSTTMKIATCYLPPSSGSIKICGYDVVENPIEVRENVGYLPEHNPLYLDMYVHEYLHFIGSLHKLGGKKLKERVAEMIELCGLTLEQNKQIGALSKGYRQRVGLAQALIHDPKVLILDEPSTGLDPNQILEIRNLIKTISKDKTVIFSTHIMQEVQALCDRVIIINRGEIVANEEVEKLKDLQQGGTLLIVEFDQEIDTTILEELEGVGSVSKREGFVYEIKVQGEKDIRADIFALTTAQNWSLLASSSEEISLEKVFQQLTKS
ncbi:MAG: gliding motility-associated ABC transporter ATP-binding subunit GldA [Cytophagales bacterium]|nr:gliding motility-associated ABC transporter ATP-binding subunit GldA [Cytophagales bacterium]